MTLVFLGGLQALDADHHQPAGERAERTDEHAGLEAGGKRARIDHDTEKPGERDAGAAPADDLAEEEHRQRDHEQRPRELQRHGVCEQHVGQRPEEAGVADGAGRAAHEVHAGPFCTQRRKWIAPQHRHHQEESDHRAEEEDLHRRQPLAEELHQRRHDDQRQRPERHQHDATPDALHGIPAGSGGGVERQLVEERRTRGWPGILTVLLLHSPDLAGWARSIARRVSDARFVPFVTRPAWPG